MAETLTSFFSGAHQLALDRWISSIGQHAINNMARSLFFSYKFFFWFEIGLEKEEQEHGNTQTTAAAKDPVTTPLMRQKQLKYISSCDCHLWQATRLMTHTRIQIFWTAIWRIWKKAFNIMVEELLIQAKLEIMNAACLFPERYLCARPPTYNHSPWPTANFPVQLRPHSSFSTEI